MREETDFDVASEMKFCSAVCSISLVVMNRFCISRRHTAVD
jgi:hypothetical protein